MIRVMRAFVPGTPNFFLGPKRGVTVPGILLRAPHYSNRRPARSDYLP